MVEKENATVKQYLFERRFRFLLVLFLTILILGPFIEDYSKLNYLFDLAFSALFLFAMYAIFERSSHLIITGCLVVPMLVSLWLKYLSELKTLIAIGEICGILFFGYSIVCIIRYFLKQKEVTKETISAAIVIYMLMAFMWARVYGLLEVFEPGSFSLPEGHAFGHRIMYLYFSFVTITTLGYGDISPLTDKASGLAIIEAFSGQIYLVVLVAWLVGMHVSKRSKL